MYESSEIVLVFCGRAMKLIWAMKLYEVFHLAQNLGLKSKNVRGRDLKTL